MSGPPPPWGERLCAGVTTPDEGAVLGKSTCVDLPVLAAIAGDFACSAPDLSRVVLQTEWLGELLEHSRDTEALLLGASATPERLDAWHGDHVGNFSIDPDYLARASGNVAHFAWPRQSSVLSEYLAEALAQGRAPNAQAFYVVFHGAALRHAESAWAARDACPSCTAKGAVSALLAEAIALHYLEDSFSAGHFVGRYGSDRTRAGTHDYYCEHGAAAEVWPEGRSEPGVHPLYVAHGDAFLQAVDRDQAALAVRRSLHDLATVLRDGARNGAWFMADELAILDDLGAPAMNPCTSLASVPPGFVAAAKEEEVLRILRVTLMPSVGKDTWAPQADSEPETVAPPFATEMGLFLGAGAAARGAVGFYTEDLAGRRLSSTMDFGGELGAAVEGITTSRTDGLVYLFAGGAIDSPDVLGGSPGQPGRGGISVRLRLPFRFVPGVEYVIPAGQVISGDSLGAKGWFVQAADRGLWGLESLHTFSGGTWQIVVGRETGFRYLWGTGPGNNAWTLELPLLEYKAPTWYAGSVGNSFSAQLGLTIDRTELTSEGLPDRTLFGPFLRLEGSTRRYTYP